MEVISRVSDWPGGLPPEVWEHIFTELPPKHIGSCALICRPFHNIVSPIMSRYKTGLAENGLIVNGKRVPLRRIEYPEFVASAMANMLEYRPELRDYDLPDNGRPDVSLRERLSILDKYYRSWERLSICPEKGFPVSSESPASSTADLTPSGWLSTADGNNSISFFNLPTITGLNPREHSKAGCFLARQIAGGSLPRHTTYRYDPSQDLLILLEERPADGVAALHVRSMATGAFHPQATLPTVEFDAVITEIEGFRIFEDRCALLVRVNDADQRVLYVWNWKTGALDDSMHGEDRLSGWGDACSLIGEENLLIVHDDSLELMCFNELNESWSTVLYLPSFRDDVVQVTNAVSQPHSQAGFGPVLRCDPPSEIVVINMVRTLQATQPNTPYGHVQSNANSSSGPSIRRNNANNEESWSAILVIQNSALLKLAESDYKTYAWSDWGPRYARFLQLPDVSQYVAPSTIGRRALIAHHSHGTPMLTVLDFNVGEEGVGTQQLATSEGWQTYVAPAKKGEDFSAFFKKKQDWKQKSDVPVRVRSKAINGLKGKMKGATLYERGFVVHVTNNQNTEHVLVPFDM